jgi:sodium transport system permease protein
MSDLTHRSQPWRSLRQVVVILRKELKDSLRDGRALFSIAFTVVIGPVLIGFMMNGVADRQREAEEVRLPVVGQEHAPALMQWLRQQSGVEIAGGPADAERAVREKAEHVVLVIEPEFGERFRVSRPASVRIVADSSRTAARPIVERVRRLLQRYSAEIGSLRLIARGVSPPAMTPLQIEEVEVSTAQQRAAQVLTFIPMFIVLAAFVGGLQIATDSTAGERERGSLEPLLVNPAPRAVFAAGKCLAAALMAMVTVALSTALCANIPRFLPLEDMGIRFRIAPLQYAAIMAAVLPMCLFSASLQACIATMARSFKEAQSYMGVLILLPMLPGMISSVSTLGEAPWMYAVPVLGQHVLLEGVMGGRWPEPWAFAAAALVSVMAAGILIRLTTTLFRSERIIFGR